MSVSFGKKTRKYKTIAVSMCCIATIAVLSPPISSHANNQDFTGLSIEELMGIEVTSVSKKAQSLSDSAAAIFVVTNEDIQRSGVTSIPDALRMVPGMNVARIDSNKWAINSRESNSRFASKLLVLIDGRSVYTPSYSGVYWEVQDVLLEDVDRIEVIRGPGATLWGANAVNGVINILTKHAADTQGGLLSLGGGDQEKAFAGARYGTSLGDGIYGRIYAKGFERDEFEHAIGGDAGDDWKMLRGGFRIDSVLNSKDSVTIQGDIYNGDINQEVDLATLTPPAFFTYGDDDIDVKGGNIIARWQHVISSSSEYTLQAYYDRTEREEAIVHEKRDSFDLDFQHRFAAGYRHDILWGVRYRSTHDDFSNTNWVIFDSESQTDQLYSAFVQDEIIIKPDKIWLTLGTKLEHNDYSGYEVQPSARLLWAPHSNHKIWTAVSRAVRTPSRIEENSHIFNATVPPGTPDNPGPFPVTLEMYGDSDYDSEELISYELGYRTLPSQNLSLDIALFYNDYDDLRIFERQTPVPVIIPPAVFPSYISQPFPVDNQISAQTYGFELAAAWQAAKWLKVNFAYSYLDSDMNAGEQVGDEPKHQVSLRGAFSLRNDINLDVWLRYVDSVSAVYLGTGGFYDIDDYVTMDVRLAWRPNDTLELSLVGQNLLDSSHVEFVQENFTRPTEIERGFYGKIAYKF
jgi:iron complex outermembrane recepter protein